jgi:hypothetical protein
MPHRTVPLTLCLALTTFLTASPSKADEKTPPKTIARAIHAEGSKAGSIEDTLHIRKASGTLELNRKVTRARLTIDLYRGGKKVRSESSSVSVQPAQAADVVRFTVQVIDLDYLPLGGGKKGHCRIVMTQELGTHITSTYTKDVAKDVFGGPMNSFGFQQFGPAAGSATVAPLFSMVVATRPDANGQTGIHGGGTVEGVVQENQANDVLIARLVFGS